ncbi:MAG: amino acid decarboxylase [Ruminococcaceae bacterium]|nr:amino acid decarboxylase [Oscillospiraceae bacterium]
MRTPICDFVKKYADSKSVRLHMPGHKGVGSLCESLDITEIAGADSLFEANGIIRESEKNASALFGSETFYSTEGSSLCIRAMVYMLSLYAKEIGRKPLILAGRNAHKTFLSALALTDTDVFWIYPKKYESYLSCSVTASELEDIFKSSSELPIAVYLTSPDYLGNFSDIAGVAEVCHKYGVLLCVDNAHGAYLKFLSPSKHPIDLGADICCDSAHKTLPALTGSAYLHVSKNAPESFSREAKNALCLFASTSPSYLLLESLDKTNAYLEGHAERLNAFLPLLDSLREELCANGYALIENEELKITIDAKAYGYYGDELADILYKNGIVCEFADRDHLVMMFTPENSSSDIDKVKKALTSIEKKEALVNAPKEFFAPVRAMSVREAVFSPQERLPIYECEGRVLASASVPCPPAVPIVVSGEIIDKNAIELFEYYGIDSCVVVKKK